MGRFRRLHPSHLRNVTVSPDWLGKGRCRRWIFLDFLGGKERASRHMLSALVFGDETHQEMSTFPEITEKRWKSCKGHLSDESLNVETELLGPSLFGNKKRCKRHRGKNSKV